MGLRPTEADENTGSLFPNRDWKERRRHLRAPIHTCFSTERYPKLSQATRQAILSPPGVLPADLRGDSRVPAPQHVIQ